MPLTYPYPRTFTSQRCRNQGRTSIQAQLMVAGVGWLTPAFVLGRASHGRLLWMFWPARNPQPGWQGSPSGAGGFGNRLNYLVDARHPGCSLGRPRAGLHSGLFKVWRLDLVVRSSILAVSGGGLG